MRAPLSDLPVVFDGVSFSAGATRILDNVSLTLVSGAPTFVLGPNGAGKSTLLRLCMGLIAPTQGVVTWGGSSDGPRRCAIQFQRPVMLRRSSLANIEYALVQAGVPRARRAGRAAELLAMVGLSDLAERPARRLSGGEQQRLALARALARDPELLLLDEPGASLDPSSARSVEQVIQAAAQSGIKLVIASHDLGQARRLAGDVVFVVRGAVREHRAAAEFFSQPSTSEAAAFLRGDLVL